MALSQKRCRGTVQTAMSHAVAVLGFTFGGKASGVAVIAAGVGGTDL